ncbi:MAG: hypothetical protein STSR0003_26340 [Smithella sp.]
MRMNQPEPFEPGGCRAKGIQSGNENAFMIAQDDHADFALAVDQQTNLPVEGAGKKGYFPGEIIAD